MSRPNARKALLRIGKDLAALIDATPDEVEADECGEAWCEIECALARTARLYDLEHRALLDEINKES